MRARAPLDAGIGADDRGAGLKGLAANADKNAERLSRGGASVNTPLAALFLSQPGLVSRLHRAHPAPCRRSTSGTGAAARPPVAVAPAGFVFDAPARGLRPTRDPVPDRKLVERNG